MVMSWFLTKQSDELEGAWNAAFSELNLVRKLGESKIHKYVVVYSDAARLLLTGISALPMRVSSSFKEAETGWW